MTKIILPVMVGVTVIETPKQIKQLAWVIILTCGFIAYECNLAYYRGWDVKANGFGGHGDAELNIIMLCSFFVAFFLALGEKRWGLRLLSTAAAALMVHVILFSLGRGAMLGLIAAGIVAFVLLPKKPIHLLGFAVAVAVTVRLAGPMVTDRFKTTFADSENRDYSAESRLEVWADLWDCAKKNPLFGRGPDHFPLISDQYGWKKNKDGHQQWLQTAAELGFPAAACLILFYALCALNLIQLLRRSDPQLDPWFKDVARFGICALVGFFVTTQFVTLQGLELPFYIVLIGASAVKIASWKLNSADIFGREFTGDLPILAGSSWDPNPAAG
jgi:O-antigen ligase